MKFFRLSFCSSAIAPCIWGSMKNMTTLSIIVPVYKVEIYIEKCISSIINNSLFDSHCELIVVDDGSPDRSMEIVERLCAFHQNVTLVRQHNQGLGMARNAGEGRAKGKYLWFVDSDDWLPAGAIERLITLTATTKPDVVSIDHIMSDGSRTMVVNNASADFIYTGIDYLKKSRVQSPVQYYIFRTDFYRGRSLHFEKGIYHEDALFTPIALFQAQRVVRLAEDCYVYNVREGSIMTSGNNVKHARDMLTIVGKLEFFRKKSGATFRQSYILSRYSAFAVGGVYYYWRLLGMEERSIVAAEMDIRLMLRPICRSGLLKYFVAVAIMRWYSSLRRRMS